MTLDDATIYSIRAVAAAAKPARKELQRLAKLCGIKANQKNTVILEELGLLPVETCLVFRAVESAQRQRSERLAKSAAVGTRCCCSGT